MGAQAFAETKSGTPQTRDTRQLAYVRCVVTALVRELPADSGQGTAWDTAVFVNDEPNAFALPGGKVGVYTGIFKVARNQDQLAAVIGHEIGHVIAHHHDERITRQLAAPGLLGVAGELAGSRWGQGAANPTTPLGGIAAQGFFLLPTPRDQDPRAALSPAARRRGRACV